jgi:putative ABC transport system permease protein
MGLLQSIRVALRSLAGNKLRTVLTMLGIIIGVAAVIALMALGSGTTASVNAQLQANGTNLLTVRSGGGIARGGPGGGVGSGQTLTYEDAVALADAASVPDAAAVVPELDSRAQVVYQGQNNNYNIISTTPNYGDVHNAPTSEGSWFDQTAVSASQNVAIIGATVVTDLFNGTDPIGQSILINRLSFRVVGVLATKGGGGFGSIDDQVFVPITTGFNKLFGKRQAVGVKGHTVSNITIQASDASTTNQAIDEVTQVLADRHNIAIGGTNDFSVINQASLLTTLDNVLGAITGFLGAIAFIALLVGGIGIMNIMLVSVTERTREIGIRKAVGATEGNILTQFLVEAIMVSVFGGILGIGLGALISYAVSALGGRLQLFGGTSISAQIDPSAVLLAVGFSVAIGLFFGIYPARRAARLNPIDALRYE